MCHDLVPAAFEFPGNSIVGDGVLRAIGARFKKTRGVSLSTICGAYHPVTAEAVEGLVMQCRQLRRLELTSCSLDTTRLMPAVVALPQLQVFG